MNSVAIDAWSSCWKPRSVLDVTDWGRQHVKLLHSARSSTFDPDQTYWLNEPLNAIPDTTNHEIYVIGPPGSAKTTMIEVGLPYVIAEDPGPAMFVMNTIDMVKEWFATRGKAVLKNCAPVMALWPNERDRDKNDAVYFSHMPFMLAGANASDLQSKSCRYVWCDEVWLWRAGMIREAKARLHDRWNQKFLATSQGGEEKTELEEGYNSGTMEVAHFQCPHCGHIQPWSIKQLLYDETKDANGIWDYQAAGKSVRYVCANEPCQAVFKNEIGVRRHLSSTLRYIATNPKPKRRVRSFQYNALCVWWIDWADLAVEWIQANEAKHAGDMGPLKKFIQKRLAQFWSEEQTVPHAALIGDDYTKSEYADGQIWDGEVARFFTVDRQKDHFWAVIRAWKQDGTSRLLFESKVLTEDALLDIQKRYKVKAGLCFMDARYDSTQVYQFCAANGWTATLGTGETSFAWVTTGKPTVYKYHSRIKNIYTGDRYCRAINFSNEKLKDIFSRLRGGHAAKWEVPGDLSEAYLYQIDSEVKRDTVDKRTKQVVMRWMKIKDNHLFDCEILQTLAANIFGFVGGAPPASSPTEEEPTPAVEPG